MRIKLPGVNNSLQRNHASQATQLATFEDQRAQATQLKDMQTRMASSPRQEQLGMLQAKMVAGVEARNTPTLVGVEPQSAPVQLRKGARKGQKQKQNMQRAGQRAEPLPGRRKRGLQDQALDLEQQRIANEEWELTLEEDDVDATENPFALLQEEDDLEGADDGREKRRIANEESERKRSERERRFTEQDTLHKKNKKKRLEILVLEKATFSKRALMETCFTKKLAEINDCIIYHEKYFPLAGTYANKAGLAEDWRNKKDNNKAIVEKAKNKQQPTRDLLQNLTDAEDLSGNEITLLHKIADLKILILQAETELVELEKLAKEMDAYLEFMGDCMKGGGGNFVKPVVYTKVYIHKVVVGCPNYHNMPWDELNNLTLTGTHGKSAHGAFVHKKLAGGYAITFGYVGGKAYVIDCGPKAPKGSNKYSWKRGGVDYDSPNGIGKSTDYQQE